MSGHDPGRPTRAEINLDNLCHNLESVKSFIKKPVAIMAVVKADGYGHGAAACALRLETAGIDWFGVALPEEGAELRRAGITRPILCLGGFWEGQEKFILENDLTPVIFQAEKAKLLDRAALELKRRARAHIKIDTGMGRVGVRYDDIENFAGQIKRLENIDFEGIMTHFAAADCFEEQKFTHLQIERFKEAFAFFESEGFHFLYKDLANSPASLAYPEAHANLIRLGGILYGLGSDVLPVWVDKPPLKPVMALYSEVSLLKWIRKGETLGYSRTFRAPRDSLIASVPIGYEDGYRRAFSNRGRVIVKGKFAPVVGRISMDWTLVDVTDIAGVKTGDKVILMGSEDDLRITAEELAEWAGTISYEITCGINKRVRRVYVESK